jgi:hypothetical protein
VGATSSNHPQMRCRVRKPLPSGVFFFSLGNTWCSSQGRLGKHVVLVAKGSLGKHVVLVAINQMCFRVARTRCVSMVTTRCVSGKKRMPRRFSFDPFFLGKRVVLVAINQMCFREKREGKKFLSRLNYGFRSIEWSLSKDCAGNQKRKLLVLGIVL